MVFILGNALVVIIIFMMYLRFAGILVVIAIWGRTGTISLLVSFLLSFLSFTNSF
jgi:hypothetical protein